MIRPYTVTRGRTRSTGGGSPEMDVIALISLADPPSTSGDDTGGRREAAHHPGADGSAVVGVAAADAASGLSGAYGTTGGSGTAVGRREGLERDAAGRVPGDGDAGAPGPLVSLGEKHLALLDHCRGGTLSVAELAAGTDLPLGVVRVLLGDLLALGRVRVTNPVPPAELPGIDLLQQVISGLKSL